MNEDKKRVDTNSDEVRTLRGQRQLELEKKLSQFNGLSYIDRFFLVRDQIFSGMKNIQGIALDTLVSDSEIRDRVSRNLVASEYLPAFVKYIDTKEDELSHLGSEISEERGYRLAIIVYLLGLTIHQSVDGNTQSINIISLSYLRQFCPKYKGNYFPIKYKEARYKNYLNVPFPTFDSTQSPHMTQKDKKLCKSIVEIRKLTKEIDDDPEYLEIVGNNYPEFERLATQKLQLLLDQIEKSTGFVFSNDVRQLIVENDYSMCALDARREIVVYLNNNYPKYTVNEWGVASNKDDSVSQQKHLLSITLSKPEGRMFLDLYIILGANKLHNQLSALNGDNPFIQDYIKVAKTLIEYENEFERVLGEEDAKRHEQQFVDVA